ncbi:Uncharacterised protein [Streptococcus pneumoniae]|nr:Uncharacterised protein [Streptococcus pneumoniae]
MVVLVEDSDFVDQGLYLKMVLVLRGAPLLHNNPHQLKVQAHHQIVQLHSLA